MNLLQSIEEVYKTSKSYPELVKKLITIGIESYTVDVSTSTILYRLANGITQIHEGLNEPRKISHKFDKDKTIGAIRDSQAGKIDYPTFMNTISDSGVRFYESTLIGTNKRVTYIGIGGYYEEQIPL